jgi:hypothetical protein
MGFGIGASCFGASACTHVHPEGFSSHATSGVLGQEVMLSTAAHRDGWPLLPRR